MRLSRVFLPAVLMVLGGVSVAQAQLGPTESTDTLFSGTYTGGNEFNTTASVTLGYDQVSSGVYLFTLNVTNQGIYGEVYRAIGLFNLPKYTLDGYWTNLAGWHLPPPNDFSGDGLTPKTANLVSADPGPTYGLQVGSSGTFQFQIHTLSLADVAAVGAGVHAISGPNGCSTKMGVTSGGVVGTAPAPGDCSSVVPEPASTALLGTGLLGLLGFAWIRRRRGLPIVREHAA